MYRNVPLIRITYFVAFLCFTTGCSAQKKPDAGKDVVVAVDQFVGFNFSEGAYELTQEHTKMLDKLGSMLKESPANNQWCLLEVVPGLKEENCLAYDRLNLIFSYLKEHYKISQSKFKVVFHEKAPIEMYIGLSIIEF